MEGQDLSDVRKDRRTIKHVEKYGISENAIYFDGNYLPLSGINKIIVKRSAYFPNHCCGKGIPVFKIGLDYGGEKLAVLMLENSQNVEKLLSMVGEEIPVSRGAE